MLRDLFGEELGHEIAVARDHPREHAGLAASASVFTRLPLCPSANWFVSSAVSPTLRHTGCVAPRARPRRGVAGVADGEVTGERGERAVVEHGGDEPLLLDDHDLVAVAHRHAGGLLPTVLEREQPEVGQLGDGLTRGVDAEDAARFLRMGGVVIDTVGQGTDP